MYIIQSSPVSPFKQQPAFLRLAAISPLCLYLQESGGYMAVASPLEAKIQISSSGKNPIWVREGGPTLRGHHTCPSSRMTTLSGGIDSPWRALQNTKVSAENDFSPREWFFIWVRHIFFFILRELSGVTVLGSFYIIFIARCHRYRCGEKIDSLKKLSRPTHSSKNEHQGHPLSYKIVILRSYHE